ALGAREREWHFAKPRNDRRAPPQVAQLLGELERGSETADRLPVLTECRLSLSQIDEGGDSRAGIALSFVRARRGAPARRGFSESAAGKGLHALLEAQCSREFIRLRRGD